MTIDVKSLYTNIPQDQGIDICCQVFEQSNRWRKPPLWFFRKCLNYILKRNFFQFNGRHFKQICGTAMGCRCAVCFANLFMGWLEDVILTTAPKGLIPSLWKRFIDDIIMIWSHGRSSLNQFIDFINDVHPTIKFEANISEVSVNFLDTTLYFDHNRLLCTKLYTMPTDCGLLLHYSSHHPISCKTSEVYSQALQLRRIISDDQELEEQLNILLVKLIMRGYPK